MTEKDENTIEQLDEGASEKFIDQARSFGIELACASNMGDEPIPDRPRETAVASWAEGAVEFGLMCPHTGRACHSMCMSFRAYVPSRAAGDFAGSAYDIALRSDPAVRGRCELLSVHVGSARSMDRMKHKGEI